MARNRTKNNRREIEVEKVPVTRESFRQALEIFKFVLPYKWFFVLGLIFLAFSTGTSFAFFYFLKDLIDPAVEQSEGWADQLRQIALILGGILVIQALFSFLRIYLFAQVSQRSLADIRNAVYRRLVVLPIPYFESQRVGELTSRITSDVTQLESTLSTTLAEFLRQILTFIIGLVLLFAESTQLTLVMLATFPPTIIAAMFIGRYIRSMGKKSQDALAEANIVTEETLQNIHVVKAFANEAYESRRYDMGIRKVVNYALKAANARGIFVVFLITAVFGGITLVIWYGASLIGAGDITIGRLIYFIMLTLFIGGSIAGLGDMYGQLQKSLGASERIRAILGEAEELPFPKEEKDEEEKPRLRGDIQFAGVRFSYPTREDIEVLRGISLHIKAGEKVALVGQSGAGKSTITQLVLRFYDADSGALLVDGEDIRNYDLHHLRRNIGIVPQEVILFGGSIRENIAYSRPDASDEEVRRAAEQAYAWEFISTFPEGLDTIVGERGIKLSGGQRQRVAIARAILKNPAILILDEATSSLDSESEHLVQQALDFLMEGRTTLVIAHRLSTIRKVDRIYVIDRGAIAEEGTHSALSLRQDGIYSNFLRMQVEEN